MTNGDIIKILFWATILLSLQVLILNNIFLFGVATPLLYVYPVIIARNDMPRWLLLCCGFVLGLLSDIFSNTPGVGAAAMTFLAFLQPYVLPLCLSRGEDDGVAPSADVFGWAKFIVYTTAMVFVYCLLYYTLDFFTVYHWQHWLKCVAGSTMLTTLFVIAVENIRSK